MLWCDLVLIVCDLVLMVCDLLCYCSYGVVSPVTYCIGYTLLIVCALPMLHSPCNTSIRTSR